MPTTPEFKTIKPTTFLFHRVETSMSEVINHVPISRELFKEALKRDLWIAGPIHWHYVNFIDPDKPFTLEIALPVDHSIADYDGPFHFKLTEEYDCACLTHEGRWDELPKSYDQLINFVKKHGRSPQAHAREIYVQGDPTNQEANVTEIQLGIN